MKTYLEEKIGNPELFAGREKELSNLLQWVDKIKPKVSKSTALLSRRKTGKSALMQRLYNIIFEQNNGVIPFYFEIKENNKWIVELSREYFSTFICQYLAFKTRKTEYLDEPIELFDSLITAIQKEKLDYLLHWVKNVQAMIENEYVDTLWDIVRDAPRKIAAYNNERVVQMIDEFQFINRFIFRDQACQNCITNLAGSYLHTCEYKNAPMLVSGSWIGWLMDDLNHFLPGRFVKRPLGNLSEDEAVEMIFKYSFLENIPVTEETAFLIARLAEGSPFYISALFDSIFEDKDLSTEAGVRKTLEYETMSSDGSINATWMEYIDAAFPRINEIHAKNIVIYLSKHRHRKVGRKELKAKLNIKMSDPELEKKLKALYKSDIIEEDWGFFRGVQDNIFDKIFRKNYADDIDQFVNQEVTQEYQTLFENIRKKYKSLSGKYNNYKGAFAEFAICTHLKYNVHQNKTRFKISLHNLPTDFEFCQYIKVWSYTSPPLHHPGFQVDLFAQAPQREYTLIGEVKNRKAKFSVQEAAKFLEKAEQLKKLEQVEKILLVVFSFGGFFKNTIKFLQDHKIAWCYDKNWLEI